MRRNNGGNSVINHKMLKMLGCVSLFLTLFFSHAANAACTCAPPYNDWLHPYDEETLVKVSDTCTLFPQGSCFANSGLCYYSCDGYGMQQPCITKTALNGTKSCGCPVAPFGCQVTSSDCNSFPSDHCTGMCEWTFTYTISGSTGGAITYCNQQ